MSKTERGRDLVSDVDMCRLCPPESIVRSAHSIAAARFVFHLGIHLNHNIQPGTG